MDKKSFINSIDYEDKNILASIYDKLILAEKTKQTIFINEFLPPNVWMNVVNMANNFYLNIHANGVFEESERRMLCFYSFEAPKEYPLQLVRIVNKSKFRELKHKDYLGAILSLGVVREKVGDLFLSEGVCFGVISSDISDYIKYNLLTIANCPCEVEFIEYNENNIPRRQFEEIDIISSSMRTDCVIAAITNLSRNKSEELISRGKVLINYSMREKKDKLIELGDVVTIRGFGKFKINQINGTTQRNRIKINILKYA